MDGLTFLVWKQCSPPKSMASLPSGEYGPSTLLPAIVSFIKTDLARVRAKNPGWWRRWVPGQRPKKSTEKPSLELTCLVRATQS
jgi:hypothetical protein